MRIIQQTSAIFRHVSGRASRSAFSIVPVVFLVALIWPFGGGGHKVQMMAGTAVPGAQATITLKTSDNRNTELDIKAQNLAQPSSLTPAENVYVVWIEPPGQSAQNQGQLRVGQNENGELHTETAFKRFQVFITAEQNAQVQMPSGPKVLSADIAGS